MGADFWDISADGPEEQLTAAHPEVGKTQMLTIRSHEQNCRTPTGWSEHSPAQCLCPGPTALAGHLLSSDRLNLRFNLRTTEASHSSNVPEADQKMVLTAEITVQCVPCSRRHRSCCQLAAHRNPRPQALLWTTSTLSTLQAMTSTSPI